MIFIAKPKAEGYRADIDGLRAIAIIGVLLFHFDIFPFSGGFVGVDVFFVISGFLITNLIYKEVTATKTFDYKRFYIRRIRRLFPALIVTLFITFVFCILLFSPEHLKRASGALISAVFSVSNIYFWNESSYFDTLSEFKPFLHTWSLSVEEQFYYVWPLLLVFLLTKLSKPKVFFTITLLVIVSLLLNVVFSDGEILLLSYLSADIAAWFTDGATTIFYLTPFRIFELGIGALLVGIVHLRPKQGVLLEILLFLGLSCIAYAMLTFNKVMTFPSYNALLPTLGAALVIYAGTAQYLGGILRNRLFVGVGLISYSLYLVHWPIYVLYKYYQLGEIDNADKIIIFILSITLAIFMYYFVEQPFRYKKTGVHINTKVFLKASLICTVLLSSSAAFAWMQQGWGWRVAPPPAEMAEQLKDSKAFHVQHYGGVGFPYLGFIYGKSPADIVLIGDSHARHYAKGLYNIIGEGESKNIFISSVSCMVLPDFTRTTAGHDWDKLCSSALDRGLDELKKTSGSVLVVSESWGYQLGIAGLLQPTREFYFDESDVSSYSPLFDSLDKLRLRIGGRKLILIGHVPGAGRSDVTACYARPNMLGNIDKCLQKLGVNVKKSAFYLGNQMLEKYAEKHEQVIFLNPYDSLCTDGVCQAISAEGLLYSDAYHLSQRGSVKVIADFKDKILGLLE